MFMLRKTDRKKTSPGRSTRNPGASTPGGAGDSPGIPRRVKLFLLPCLLLIALAMALTPALAFGQSNSNSQPSFANATATRSVAENSAANANVGAAVTATDQDDTTLAYSLSGTDASKFDIGSTTGQITVKAGTTLDYESGTTSYSVTVGVSDSKDSSGTADTVVDDTIAVTINVADVNEPPGKSGDSEGRPEPRQSQDKARCLVDCAGYDRQAAHHGIRLQVPDKQRGLVVHLPFEPGQSVFHQVEP